MRVDDAGNALAVWTYRDSSALSDRNFTSQVFVSRRDALTNTWSTPQVLQNDQASYARDAHLTVEGGGLAWAVWTERTFKDAFFSTRDHYAVFAAKFDPASGWSTPEKITGDLNGVLRARVTTDRHGNPRVIVAFQNGLGTEYTLYVARRSVAGSWGSLETIAFATPAGGLAPDLSENDLAVDSNDNAVAVWREYDGTRYLIRTRHYSAGGGWDPVVDLQPPGRDNGFAPQLAMDDAGNGFVVWHQFDFDRAYGIWSARFEQALGWTAIEIISSPADMVGDDSTFPRVGVAGAGNAVAIWTKYDFHLNQTIVRANYYSRTSGWGADETISRGPGVSWRPELAVASSGYATAVWWQEINNLFQAWSASRPPTP